MSHEMTGPKIDEAKTSALLIPTIPVVTPMGSGRPDFTVKPVGVGIPALTIGPLNVAALFVTEPKVEGHTPGAGVKTPITVGFATPHGIVVSAAHGATHRPTGPPQ